MSKLAHSNQDTMDEIETKYRESEERGERREPPGLNLVVVQDALTDAAQFIDAVKQDAKLEGWWTDWDEKMRGKITTALEQIIATR